MRRPCRWDIYCFSNKRVKKNTLLKGCLHHCNSHPQHTSQQMCKSEGTRLHSAWIISSGAATKQSAWVEHKWWKPENINISGVSLSVLIYMQKANEGNTSEKLPDTFLVGVLAPTVSVVRDTYVQFALGVLVLCCHTKCTFVDKKVNFWM